MPPEACTQSLCKSERLAYWYFRLNGFMTIENFLVHPEFGSNIRTDVDILATRFKYRHENIDRPMIDDSLVTDCETFANVIITEITNGTCKLNGPWTNRDDENMERVLRSIGCTREEEVGPAAQELYATGRWSNTNATIRLFAIGEQKNGDLIINQSQQIEWPSIIDFCIRRFSEYQQQKKSNGQWSSEGKHLRALALKNNSEAIRRDFGLRLEGAAP